MTQRGWTAVCKGRTDSTKRRAARVRTRSSQSPIVKQAEAARPAAVQKTTVLEVPMHLRTEGELTISTCGSVKPSVRADQVRPLRAM